MTPMTRTREPDLADADELLADWELEDIDTSIPMATPIALGRLRALHRELDPARSGPPLPTAGRLVVWISAFGVRAHAASPGGVFPRSGPLRRGVAMIRCRVLRSGTTWSTPTAAANH